MARPEKVISMTRKEISMEQLIKTNPQVDAKQFAEAMRLLGELRRLGVKRQEYGLIQPFTRHYHDTAECDG